MRDVIESAGRHVGDSVGKGVREAAGRLRRPGAVFGPKISPADVPNAPGRIVLRTAQDVAARLPRGEGTIRADRVHGALAPRGWTGEMFRVGEDGAPLAFVRRLPIPIRKAALVWDIALTLTGNAELGSDIDDRHVVELLDLEGQVLLRSAFGHKRRRGGGRTMRSVALADGTPIADVVRRARGASQLDVVPARSLRVQGALIDVEPMPLSWEGGGRVWRGTRELAVASREGGVRAVTLGHLASDDEALLVWAAALSWWGGP